MDRKQFLKTCGYGCLGLLGASLILESCAPAKQVTASPENNIIKLSQTEFNNNNPKKRNADHLLVKVNGMDFPILLTKTKNNTYSAISLQCTHQGVELTVNGNILTCSAHGSEFDTSGQVLQGPADQSLKAFKVDSDTNHIYIHLT